MTEARYTLVIAPTARRQLTEHLPDAAACAAYEFVMGALLDNPQRVGKRLHAPLADRHAARRGTYRVIYRIDEPRRTVSVLAIVHRADASQRKAWKSDQFRSWPGSNTGSYLRVVRRPTPRGPASTCVRPGGWLRAGLEVRRGPCQNGDIKY